MFVQLIYELESLYSHVLFVTTQFTICLHGKYFVCIYEFVQRALMYAINMYGNQISAPFHNGN